MRVMTDRWCVPALALALFAGCSGGAEPDAGSGTMPGATPAASAPMEAAAGMPSGAAGRRADMDGKAGAPVRLRSILVPRHRVDVLARLPGLITSVQAEEGERVSGATILARLDDEPARLARDKAAAEAERASAVYERNRRGAGQQGVSVVSAMDLEVSEASYKMARADSALREMELAYTRVRSPIAGRVTERLVDTGDWVVAGERLFTIADLRVLRAEFVVPFSQQAALQTGSTVRLVVDPDGMERVVEGTLVLKSPVVDPASGGVKVTVEIANGDGNVHPGLPVEFTIGG